MAFSIHLADDIPSIIRRDLLMDCICSKYMSMKVQQRLEKKIRAMEEMVANFWEMGVDPEDWDITIEINAWRV